MVAENKNIKIRLAFVRHEQELLDVRHFSIHQAMNQLFEIRVLAISGDDNIDLNSIVGKGAALMIDNPNHEALTRRRAWAGICANMAQVHAEPYPGVSTYQLLIVPMLWRTTLRRNCRIFQHKTTPEIVQELLAEWHITPIVRLDPSNYRPHEYCVQYGESDYAFMSRLLEDAGISFYFEPGTDEDGVPITTGNGDDITKLVLNDAPDKNAQRRGPLVYAGHQAPSFGADEDFCATVSLSQRMKPGAFKIRDFDFRLSHDTPLAARRVASTEEQDYEQYDYAHGAFRWGDGVPGDTPTADDKAVVRTARDSADALVQRSAHAERRRRLLVTFQTNAVDLAPGKIVAINQEAKAWQPNHPRDDLGPDKKLLVTEAWFEGDVTEEWLATVSAVFADDPYRPQRCTPRPRIYGVQSALVVGPPNEEIHTDEFGRVRVQFHWDREGQYNDNSSCWIRVSQAWAGNGFGSMNIPRVGHEVLVEFFDGDPDRPVITGRVYNKRSAGGAPGARVPHELPANKTQSWWKSNSSPGAGTFNGIRFEDLAGSEEMFVHAGKDHRTIVGNDREAHVTRNCTTNVGGDQSRNVNGNDSHRIDSSKFLDVGQNLMQNVGSTAATNAQDKWTVSFGQSSTITMEAGPPPMITLTTGKASIVLKGGQMYCNAEEEMHLHSTEKSYLTSKGEVYARGSKIHLADRDHGKARATPATRNSPVATL